MPQAPQPLRGLRSALVPQFLISAAILAALLWLALLANAYARRVGEAVQWRTHTFEVLAAINRLDSGLARLETDERTYVATGSDSYLQGFDATKHEVPRDIEALRRLTSDNASQQQRLADLDPIVRNKAAREENAIRLRREQGRLAAENSVTTANDLRDIEQIRALLVQMRAAETRLLLSRTDEVDRSNVLLVRTQRFLVVAVLVLFGAGAYLFVSDARRRTREERVILESRQALAVEREFLSKVLENLQSPVVTAEVDGTIRMVNAAARAFWGLGEAPIVASEWPRRFSAYESDAKTVIPPDQIPIYRALRGETVTNCEMVVRDSEGPSRRIVVSAAPLRGFAGNITGAVLVQYDVSELRERSRQVEVQAQLLDLAPMGVFVRDFDGTIRYWNRGATEMYGWTADEAVGRRTHELLKTVFFVPFEQIVSALYRDRHWEGELIHTRRDGSQMTAASRWALVASDDSSAPTLLEVNTDISEQKRAAELERRHTEELARSNAELERFAYVASHDLQEPLRMVASYTDLLAETYKDQLDERARRYMGYAVDGARRMQELIADLLTLSRVRAETQPLQQVRAGDALASAMSNLKLSIESAGAIVTTSDLPLVFADPVQLALVFQNLLSNALKYRSSARPSIRISCRREGPEWLFAVQDNGIGMKPEDTQKIFEAFHRLHRRADYPGTGIGLAICKRIIEHHGGRVWAQSKPGEGSTFFFTLPARANDDSSIQSASPEEAHA